MEDYTNPELQEEEILEEEEELSFSDKIVGLFTEPSATFESIAKYDLKFVDWFLPFFILMIVLLSSQFILAINPEIELEMFQQASETIQKSVDAGDITQQQAEMQLDFMKTPMFAVIQIIGGSIASFFMFFVIVTFYFILAKFALKGDGSYKGAMVATSFPAFITLVQMILLIIVSFAFGTHVKSFSLTTLLDLDIKTFAGFILSKIDPFTIFSFTVTGIAFAKLFKSEDVKKYVFAIIGSWLGFSLLIFALSKSIPFFDNFIQ